MKYSEIKKALNNQELTSTEICGRALDRIEKVDPVIHTFLSLKKDKILESARASDHRRSSGKPLSEYDGIPIGIKDNICIQNERTSCASKMLENFISPYHATVIEKLLSKGFILFPNLNMDEFAMGSSTENSAFTVTKNPFDTSRIPGGSSGGSAAAVAAGMLPISLGSDTGGSIRQPASLCGVWGLKPSYGRVSRYGLVAYASSLDQIGPISNDPQGIADVFSVISGHDPKDSTSKQLSPFDTKEVGKLELSGLKIGIMKGEGSKWSEPVKKRFYEAVEILKSKGCSIVELDFSLFDYSVPIYYIIATAECSSNLSRFDGIRYGLRVNHSNRLEDVYLESRSAGFGKEVKRRILLGTFSLSSGYYDAYYGKAQKTRVLLKKNMILFFNR